MSEQVDWSQVAQHLDDLYTASAWLEQIFLSRKFTLDGHLVGSNGEVVAAYIFDLALNPASTLGHDATSTDGKKIEINMTQVRGVAIRHEPEQLIVLHRPQGGPVRIVYNGPGGSVWQEAGAMQRNGQRPISLRRLEHLDALVPDEDRLKPVCAVPV